MGTRNLTMVQHGGEIKVAQYGQWDGYQSGQGATILRFCSDAENLERLKAKMASVRFLTDKKEIEAINAKIQANDKELIDYYHRIWGRDVCGDILQAIIDEEGEVLLQNDFNFGYNSLFCEWAYCVNLDTNKLEVYCGFNDTKLDKTERFYKDKPTESGSYGIRKIKEYDIDNLPTEEDFVNELEGGNE